MSSCIPLQKKLYRNKTLPVTGKDVTLCPIANTYSRKEPFLYILLKYTIIFKSSF